MIEPYELPSDAAVREMWEETGLAVELVRIVGVFGGELCRHTYGNGDRVSFVSTTFEARVLGGTLRPDGEETLEARYANRDEIATLSCKAHVPMLLAAASEATAFFQRPTWTPPSAPSVSAGAAHGRT